MVIKYPNIQYSIISRYLIELLCFLRYFKKAIQICNMFCISIGFVFVQTKLKKKIQNFIEIIHFIQ